MMNPTKPDLKQMICFLVIVCIVDILMVGFFIQNGLARPALIVLILVIPAPAVILLKLILLERKKQIEMRGGIV